MKGIRLNDLGEGGVGVEKGGGGGEIWRLSKGENLLKEFNLPINRF